MVMVKKIKESRAIINYSTILNISFEFPIWKVGKTQNIQLYKDQIQNLYLYFCLNKVYMNHWKKFPKTCLLTSVNNTIFVYKVFCLIMNNFLKKESEDMGR